ncbi:MAG: sigma-54-dependent Fis family transcriptional regulator [Planctomycetota bacterium]|nr:MAG: sigma-54-dependent Fis family transcriptional regulator [Planctomycetota bacterium]
MGERAAISPQRLPFELGAGRVPVDPATVSILVIENDPLDASRLADALAEEGYRTEIAPEPRAALQRLEARGFDVVVTELELAGGLSCFDVLRAAREREDETQVIVLTADGGPEHAVQAMLHGALGYLSKPVNMDELKAVIRRAAERVYLERHARELEQRLDERYGFEAIIGNSPRMQRVFEIVRQAAPTNATVLLLGESGTGKELIARTIHQNSPRRHHPFVALNCAALSESILESELFGHEKGAFTGASQQRKGRFEYAHKGTLFLDEVGDMPPSTQVKLLRVLEEREIVRVGSNVPIKVDVRVIAATNADLEAMVEEGRFRRDLYYRLRVVTIRLPPLRERPTDIPLLIEHFVREFAAEHGKVIDAVTPEARRVLTSYPWPGNVRELRNAIEHAVVVATTPVIDVGDLPDYITGGQHEPRGIEGLAGRSLEELERELIRQTLELTGGNREQAARMLAIGERTLYRKIKKYGLR